MKPVVWGLLLAAALIVQASFLPLLAVNGVRPDLLLLVVVSAGLLFGREQGVGMGFFAGLLQDLAAGNIFGVCVLSKTATGYMAGLMERNVFKERFLLPVLAVAVATVFNNAVMLTVVFVLGFEVELPAALTNTFFVMGYNTVLAIPVYRLVSKVAGSEMTG